MILNVVAIAVFSQNENKKEQIGKQGSIVFKSTVYDFGKILKGSDGKAEFVFKNISKQPILISNVKPSCGCTEANWTKEPIKKNKKGKISATYNTQNIGKFQKTISVYIEGQEQAIQIEIKGEVLE
jgi:hypothetical protein